MSSADVDTPNNANNLVRVLGDHYTIFDTLCGFLDVNSIIALTRACRGLSHLYRQLLLTQWNIDGRLKRFVKDPKLFRAVLGNTNAVISGGFALQFFDRALWEKSDIDIYVEASGVNSPQITALRQYLEIKEGYRYPQGQTHTYDRDAGFQGIDHVITLEKGRNEAPDEGRKIQILVCRHTPAKIILGGFYCSAVVNIITWEAAYCVFPQETFTKRLLYMMTPPIERHKALLKKYEGRGWGVVKDRVEYPVVLANKLLGRKTTWKIHFDTTGVDVMPQPAFALERTHVNLSTRRTSDEEPYYEVTAAPFTFSLGLKYTYLYGDRLWAYWLSFKLRPLVLEQLHALEDPQRPPFYEEACRNNSRVTGLITDWNPPASWTYYDDKIIEWFNGYKDALKDNSIMEGYPGLFDD